MSFPRYPTYKPSGVEWLGEVPEHWEVLPLKRRSRLLTEKTECRDNPIALENIEGWTGRLVETDSEFLGEGVAFEPGDILFGKLRPYLAKVYLAAKGGQAVGDFHVIHPFDSLHPRFLQFLLLTKEMIDLVNGSTFGAKMPRASWDFLASLHLSIPPLDEQSVIATFLDHETAKIDALIAEQQRLIELLQEKRQAVISHAVTKGLNPDAPMKNSGVEWLGEVPEHWEVCRVKAVSVFSTSGPRGWSERVGDVGALFVQSGDLTDVMGVDFANCKRVQVGDDAEAARTKLLDGDLVVCITGAKTGNVAVCESVPESSYVNQHLCLIRPGEGVHPRFLAALLKSGCGQTYFSLAQYGLKQGLSLEDVREARVALPPLDEQDRICQCLRGVSSRYLPLEAESQRTISLLQERRSALISAAVTGQIDVRGMVPVAEAA
jgi:type I restriction enzyme, S subunit